jgi:hypothetical protein
MPTHTTRLVVVVTMQQPNTSEFVVMLAHIIQLNAQVKERCAEEYYAHLRDFRDHLRDHLDS